MMQLYHGDVGNNGILSWKPSILIDIDALLGIHDVHD
jgi:hypothetical protein